jgi:hypothetical protein
MSVELDSDDLLKACAHLHDVGLLLNCTDPYPSIARAIGGCLEEICERAQVDLGAAWTCAMRSKVIFSLVSPMDTDEPRDLNLLARTPRGGKSARQDRGESGVA